MDCARPDLFANSGSLRTDDCATEVRDRTNQMFREWTVFNPRKNTGASPLPCKGAFLAKDGGGDVSDDSHIRLQRFSGADRKKQQLFPRTFVACAGLENGDFLPHVDSWMTRGAIQQRDRRWTGRPTDCDALSEMDQTYSMMPMIPCLRNTIQDPAHIILPSGMPSRSVVRSPEFLSACHEK
jgi:hypothetical protein